MNKQEILSTTGLSESEFYKLYPTEASFKKKNPKMKLGGGLPKFQTRGQVNVPSKWVNGPVSQEDSVRNMTGNQMRWEHSRGDRTGVGLDNYGNPDLVKALKRNPTEKEAVDDYMQKIYPQVKDKYPTAMEQVIAGDLYYNSGKEAYNYLNWDTRKDPAASEQNWNEVMKASDEDARRKALNNGRDRYYKNTAPKDYIDPQTGKTISYDYGKNAQGDYIKDKFGAMSPAYQNSWYGRQHASDQYVPYTEEDFTNEDNPLFYKKVGGGLPKAQNGVKIIPGLVPFEQAYYDARTAGKNAFDFEGKLYNTKSYEEDINSKTSEQLTHEYLLGTDRGGSYYPDWFAQMQAKGTAAIRNERGLNRNFGKPLPQETPWLDENGGHAWKNGGEPCYGCLHKAQNGEGTPWQEYLKKYPTRPYTDTIPISLDRMAGRQVEEYPNVPGYERNYETGKIVHSPEEVKRLEDWMGIARKQWPDVPGVPARDSQYMKEAEKFNIFPVIPMDYPVPAVLKSGGSAGQGIDTTSFLDDKMKKLIIHLRDTAQPAHDRAVQKEAYEQHQQEMQEMMQQMQGQQFGSHMMPNGSMMPDSQMPMQRFGGDLPKFQIAGQPGAGEQMLISGCERLGKVWDPSRGICVDKEQVQNTGAGLTGEALDNFILGDESATGAGVTPNPIGGGSAQAWGTYGAPPTNVTGNPYPTQQATTPPPRVRDTAEIGFPKMPVIPPSGAQINPYGIGPQPMGTIPWKPMQTPLPDSSKDVNKPPQKPRAPGNPGTPIDLNFGNGLQDANNIIGILNGISQMKDTSDYHKWERENKWRFAADNTHAVVPAGNQGQYDQWGRLMPPNYTPGRYGQEGGQFGFAEGDEVDLSPQEVEEFLRCGGQIEYL